MDKDLATTLYRMLQEALTNIVRHAKATAVDITLRTTPHHLQLKVADNGRGITQRELDDMRSLGLLGMRERARTWSGEVVIRGAAGRGTRVIVTIPLRRAAP